MQFILINIIYFIILIILIIIVIRMFYLLVINVSLKRNYFREVFTTLQHFLHYNFEHYSYFIIILQTLFIQYPIKIVNLIIDFHEKLHSCYFFLYYFKNHLWLILIHLQYQIIIITAVEDFLYFFLIENLNFLHFLVI